MRQLAVLGVIAAFVVGCGSSGDDAWVGEPDGFEPDDTTPTAREQRMNSRPVRHTFASDDISPDEDWVRIRVTETDISETDSFEPYYQFGSIPVSGMPMVRLLSEHGDLVLGPATGYSPLFLMDTPGVYFMKFYESSGVGGEYNSYVGVRKDSGGADVAVTSVVLPRELPAGEDDSVDVDVHVVNQGDTAAANVTVKLYVTSQRRVDAEPEIASQLVADLPAATFGDAPSAGETITFTGVDFSGPSVPIGPVYVVAEATLSADSDLSNNFCVTSTLHSVDTGDAWETADAIDDDLVTTTRAPVVPGTAEAHTFFPATDVDVVPISISSGAEGYYEIWTSNVRGGVNTRLELVDSVGEPVAADANACGNGMEGGSSYLARNLAIGSHYVWIDEVSGLTGAYDLNVRKSELPGGPDALEFDDDLDTQDDVRPWHAIRTPVLDEISTPPELLRSFHRNDDVDWVLYSVPGASHLMDHVIEKIPVVGSLADPVFELFEADGDPARLTDVIVTPVYIGGGISRTLPAGLYYIRITNDAAADVGEYKIKATVTTP